MLTSFAAAFRQLAAVSSCCCIRSRPGTPPPPSPLRPRPRHAAWTKIPIPPLHAIQALVWPKRASSSPTASIIFLQEDHELPFVDGSILIRGGSRDEPAAKVGLVSLYGQTWRTSGTASKPGDALDAELAQKAASIETSGGGATKLRCPHWGSFKQDWYDTVFRRSGRPHAASRLQGGQTGAGQARDGYRHLSPQ